MSPQHRQRGFTLLELIVVIAIFAVLAAMAYGGLSSVLNARVQIEAKMAQTAQYQKVYLLMRQDFQNASQRAARDNNGDLQPAMIYDHYSRRLDFTRGGWTNPLHLPRTGFERVSYRFEDGKFIRDSYRVLDRAQQTTPVSVTLLTGVDAVDWQFLDDKLEPSDNWPPQQLNGGGAINVHAPPLAVEVHIRTRDWGELRFLFKLGYDPNGENGENGWPLPLPENG